MKQLFFIVFAVGLVQINGFATEPFPDNKSLKEQYTFLLENSKSYGNYKAVTLEYLNKFSGNLNDSLKYYYFKTADLSSRIEESKKANVEAVSKVETLSKELEESLLINNSISFMGIEFTKGSYNTMVWAVIFALFGLIIFGSISYKRMMITSKQCRDASVKLETELSDLREKKLETEIVLKRKLQTALNRLEDQGIHK